MNTTWCPHLETDNVALNLQVRHLAPFQKNRYLSPYVQQLSWTIEQNLWYSLAVMKIWFLKLWRYTMYWAMANLRSKPEVVRTSCHLFTGTSETKKTKKTSCYLLPGTSETKRQRKLRVTCSQVQAKQIWQKLSEKARQCSAVSSINSPWSLGKPNIEVCCLVWRSSPWITMLYSFCWFPSGDNSKIHEHAITSQKLTSTWWPHKNKKLSLPQAPLCKTIISTSLKKSGTFTATPMTKLQQEGKQGKQLAHHTSPYSNLLTFCPCSSLKLVCHQFCWVGFWPVRFLAFGFGFRV
jgi:hypothetical protein